MELASRHVHRLRISSTDSTPDSPPTSSSSSASSTPTNAHSARLISIHPQLPSSPSHSHGPPRSRCYSHRFTPRLIMLLICAITIFIYTCIIIIHYLQWSHVQSTYRTHVQQAYERFKTWNIKNEQSTGPRLNTSFSSFESSADPEFLSQRLLMSHALDTLFTTHIQHTHDITHAHPTSRRLHPSERLQEQCPMEWFAPWKKMHDEIRSGATPGRTIVYRDHETGLSDTITGLITSFAVAILTGSALEYNSIHLLSRAYATSVNITMTSRTHQQMVHGDYIQYKQCTDPSQTDTIIDTPLKILPTFRSICPDPMQILTSTPSPSPSRPHPLYVWHTYGMIYSLFSTPHWSSILTRLGFQRDSMFACLYHTLFQAREETWRGVLTSDAISVLHPSSHVIVLQPRMGDQMAFLKPNKSATSTPTDIHAFITCVSDLASSISTHVVREHLYTILSADAQSVRQSSSIRESIMQYTRLIMPHDNITVLHFADSATGPSTLSLNNPAATPILTPAQIASRTQIACDIVGEWWLMSMAHSFVITRISGYGRMPLFQSFPRARYVPTVTQIDRHLFTQEKRCRAAKDFHTLEVVADTWSGI